MKATVTTERNLLALPDVLRPILTLTEFSDEQRSHLAKLVEVTHGGKKYTVGDVESGAYASENVGNRKVFAMMSYLFAQLSIDPQKLPVQQLIQVR